MKILHISDTHNSYPNLPECDLLIHTGDLTNSGTAAELEDGINWLSSLKAKHKIFVPGNHDQGLDSTHVDGMSLPDVARFILSSQDRGVQIVSEGIVDVEGLLIGCVSLTPNFGGWAFGGNVMQLHESYNSVLSSDIDILATHGPAFGVLDLNFDRFRCGSEILSESLMTYRHRNGKPIIAHLFGHIHESRGVYPPFLDGQMMSLNSSQKWNMIEIVDGQIVSLANANGVYAELE